MKYLPTLAWLVVAAPGAAQAPMYDLLITGGRVLDGTGVPAFDADVAIRGDRIVNVSRARLPGSTARRVIDATGLVVAPGFIDMHAHLEPLGDWPDAESAVRQGVTTVVGNPDGGGPYPIARYLQSLEARPLGLNAAFFVGHNTIRRRVMGLADRAPTEEEQHQMEALVRQGMEDGAFGLSTGLFYLPGTFAETDEVVALARVAASFGGIYTSHLRKEGLGLFDGVAEAIDIARGAGIPVVLTHHKAVGKTMWGSSTRTLAMLDSARTAGLDVMADQYPYTATSTGIAALIPAWAMAGGDTAFARRVQDPTVRDSVTAGIIFNINNDRGGGDLSRVQFSRVSWMPILEGKTLADWAAMQRLPPTPEHGADLVIEFQLRGGGSGIFHVLDEGDVERIMRHPMVAIASDGRLSRPGVGHPHPRSYGTFPRVLGHFVRERRVLSLEEAVRKMTALPATRLGLTGRGRLTEGLLADVTIFDPATVLDRATFAQPHQYPQGIPWVIVNGTIVVDAGRFTSARPGRVLHHR